MMEPKLSWSNSSDREPLNGKQSIMREKRTAPSVPLSGCRDVTTFVLLSQDFWRRK